MPGYAKIQHNGRSPHREFEGDCSSNNSAAFFAAVHARLLSQHPSESGDAARGALWLGLLRSASGIALNLSSFHKAPRLASSVGLVDPLPARC